MEDVGEFLRILNYRGALLLRLECPTMKGLFPTYKGAVSALLSYRTALRALRSGIPFSKQPSAHYHFSMARMKVTKEGRPVIEAPRESWKIETLLERRVKVLEKYLEKAKKLGDIDFERQEFAWEPELRKLGEGLDLNKSQRDLFFKDLEFLIKFEKEFKEKYGEWPLIHIRWNVNDDRALLEEDRVIISTTLPRYGENIDGSPVERLLKTYKIVEKNKDVPHFCVHLYGAKMYRAALFEESYEMNKKLLEDAFDMVSQGFPAVCMWKERPRVEKKDRFVLLGLKGRIYEKWRRKNPKSFLKHYIEEFRALRKVLEPYGDRIEREIGGNLYSWEASKMIEVLKIYRELGESLGFDEKKTYETFFDLRFPFSSPAFSSPVLCPQDQCPTFRVRNYKEISARFQKPLSAMIDYLEGLQDKEKEIRKLRRTFSAEEAKEIAEGLREEMSKYSKGPLKPEVRGKEVGEDEWILEVMLL